MKSKASALVSEGINSIETVLQFLCSHRLSPTTFSLCPLFWEMIFLSNLRGLNSERHALTQEFEVLVGK